MPVRNIIISIFFLVMVFVHYRFRYAFAALFGFFGVISATITLTSKTVSDRLLGTGITLLAFLLCFVIWRANQIWVRHRVTVLQDAKEHDWVSAARRYLPVLWREFYPRKTMLVIPTLILFLRRKAQEPTAKEQEQ